MIVGSDKTSFVVGKIVADTFVVLGNFAVEDSILAVEGSIVVGRLVAADKQVLVGTFVVERSTEVDTSAAVEHMMALAGKLVGIAVVGIYFFGTYVCIGNTL